MTTQEQIYNWLITGLQQSPVKFSEVFYYDKRDKQFFSILMTDYFLFDGNGELNKDASSTYSEATLVLLTDRIRRINIDPQIIAIPRLGDTDEDYLQQADSFLNLNAINVDESTIWDVEESGSITFNLK
ncbi:hypothetical protein PQ469_30880 [Mucilaginibacter sp. KACC 22773]|jgi:hypothetical protein|uniref:hypothetical protein n=1 Tax=Mucilaginibacter sp. KACC 22773 TaxID=3025671 RepID=UPI0023659159|nr:hypothetical protein [Mucilaginibacter sp. KACC 22773]WDF78294.1 hypothetical protein PQ469_30880 [Mucilaginibacter sp. KACC 22773]